MAFLNSAPHNYVIHSQAIYWNFMKSPKHQMIPKAFTLEWTCLLPFALGVCLTLEFSPWPLSWRHRVVCPGELRRFHSSLPCSLLSPLLISHFHLRVNITWGLLSMQPQPVLSRPFSKRVLWLPSLRAGEGILYLGVNRNSYKVRAKLLRIELKDKLRQWHQQKKVN